MSKRQTQTVVQISGDLLHAEESTIQDNSLLPAAAELERLVVIDENVLEWYKEYVVREQLSRHKHNDERMSEYRTQGKRTFVFNILSLLIAFAIVAGGGTASVFLALKGLSIEGSILGGVTLVAAAGVFLRKNKNTSEKEMRSY